MTRRSAPRWKKKTNNAAKARNEVKRSRSPRCGCFSSSLTDPASMSSMFPFHGAGCSSRIVRSLSAQAMYCDVPLRSALHDLEVLFLRRLVVRKSKYSQSQAWPNSGSTDAERNWKATLPPPQGRPWKGNRGLPVSRSTKRCPRPLPCVPGEEHSGFERLGRAGQGGRGEGGKGHTGTSGGASGTRRYARRIAWPRRAGSEAGEILCGCRGNSLRFKECRKFTPAVRAVPRRS